MKDLKLIIYPSCPLEGIKRVDLEFRTESETAKKYFQVGNIDIDQIKVETLSSLPSFNLFVSETPLKAIYRGWMLSVDRYNVLYDYLKEKYNIILINSPKQYSNCHYFPNAYDSISAYTPKAIFRPVKEIEDLIKLSAITFNDKSIFLKDYVKSESAYLEATFVENGANTANLKKAIDKLIELRGKELNIGIVIKEQIDISRISNEDLEWRAFVFEGHILGVFKRFNSDMNLDHEQQAKLYQLISDVSVNLQKVSNFFTIDIVLQADEQFVLMEVGDGQVSGVPYDNDIAIFYKNLSEV